MSYRIFAPSKKANYHSKWTNRLCAAGLLAVMTACGAEPSDIDQSSANANEQIKETTPLEALFPGQRMPSVYSRIEGAAYLLIDLDQADDAVSGEMRLTLDGRRNDDCEKLADGLGPWLSICQSVVQRGERLELSAPATIRRTSAGAAVMGAYASFEQPAGLGTTHLTIFSDGYGGWDIRPRPNSDIALGPFEPPLELDAGEDARARLANSEALILEARTKD